MKQIYNRAFNGFLLFFTAFAWIPSVSAQQVLFDFDNAPLHSNLPLYQTSGGITAYLTATGQGYSIQNANVLGFTPPGFYGRILYPNSINISDIRIHYDHALTDFSILYACQELGCEDAATMRVTAFLNGAYVGTNTRTATFPGTWPVDTLRCSFPQGFDSVVIHYDSPPPTCHDYGTIYIADNMRVTPVPTGIITGGIIPEEFVLYQNYPNPFNPTTKIRYSVPSGKYQIVNTHIKIQKAELSVYNILGEKIEVLFNKVLNPGIYEVEWDGSNYPSGVYFYKLDSVDFTEICKMVLLK